MSTHPFPTPTPGADNDHTEVVIPPYDTLMMTVEDTSATTLSTSTDKTPYQKRVKQLATLFMKRRELEESQRIPTPPEQHSTMEYTIEFMQTTKETPTDGYDTFETDTLPVATLNYRFTQEYETKTEYYETVLRRVGDMLVQHHRALLEHALQMKEIFEATNRMFQAKSYSFVFKYDTTHCQRPDEDLDPGDIRYLIQMSRYYHRLQIHLHEAYRIHKRCTHYKKQAYEFKDREYQLRKSMTKLHRQL